MGVLQPPIVVWHSSEHEHASRACSEAPGIPRHGGRGRRGARGAGHRPWRRALPTGPGRLRPTGPRSAHDLTGQLIRPSEAFYTIARRLFDPRFDSISPAGIAYCRSPHDVATCLAFVRKFKIPVAARCGGHGYAGIPRTPGAWWSTSPGWRGSGSSGNDGDGRRRRPAGRLLQLPRRPRPGHARRVVPDRRHLRPDAGRRRRRGGAARPG